MKENKEKDSIIIYWSPWWDPNLNINLDMFYQEPEQVYTNLLKNFKPPTVTKNFMNCPAVKDHLQKLYVVFNPSDTAMNINFDENNIVSGLEYGDNQNTNVPGALKHSPTLVDNYLIEYGLSYSFFCEEPLEVTITSPYFHKTNLSKYGAIVPGTFDIGRWYRPFVCEFNLWAGNTGIELNYNDPIAYFQFHTDKKIIFKRYRSTKVLYEIAVALINFKQTAKWKTLLSRYLRFDISDVKKIIISEIKNNLVV